MWILRGRCPDQKPDPCLRRLRSVGLSTVTLYSQRMDRLRSVIREQVHDLVGVGTGGARHVRKDDGLFGRSSVCWKVHSDVTTMMIGGVSALLLQMLHPAALAGVWDHSNFRHDMLGRLRRTAQFISGTTYGDTDRAFALIARVRAVHDRVEGVLPDGTPYSANDPALLTWIHVAEVSSFLRAYVRYRDPFLPRSEQDRYFAEVSEIAVLLGAEAVPRSRREVSDYLRASRAELRFDRRTRQVADALLEQPASSLSLAPFQRLVLDAGVDLLPDWAAEIHGLRIAPLRRPAIRASAVGVGSVLRWALS